MWIVARHIPYEGINEEYCTCAREVIEYLDSLNPLDRDGGVSIRPSGRTYDEWDFRAAVELGEID